MQADEEAAAAQLRKLLSEGLDPNLRQKPYGEPLLCEACSAVNVTLARVLLESKANPDLETGICACNPANKYPIKNHHHHHHHASPQQLVKKTTTNITVTIILTINTNHNQRWTTQLRLTSRSEKDTRTRKKRRGTIPRRARKEL
jgi:ankyrin repeat protein